MTTEDPRRLLSRHIHDVTGHTAGPGPASAACGRSRERAGWRVRVFTGLAAAAVLLVVSSCSSLRPAVPVQRGTTAANRVEPEPELPRQVLGDGSVRFEPNRGQWPDGVLFAAWTRSGGVVVRAQGVELVSTGKGGARARLPLAAAAGAEGVAAEQRLAGSSHYYLGEDPARWRAGVPGYGRVRLREVFPGVDVVLAGAAGELELSIVAGSPGDLAAFRLGVDGARLEPRPDGTLGAKVGGDVLQVGTLRAFVGSGGGWRTVEVGYTGTGVLGFEPRAELDGGPVVVDPVLSWSAALQGKFLDHVESVAAMPDGGFIAVGSSSGGGFPGAPETSGRAGAFVGRFDADHELVWMTFLKDVWGGSSSNAVAVGAGGIWVAGDNYGTGFPVLNGLQSPDPSSTDAFLVRLSEEGVLEYATCLGGSGPDRATGVAVLGDDTVVVAGETSSADFPVAPGAADPDPGEVGSWSPLFDEGFVTAVTADGQTVRWSTFLGGAEMDEINAVAVTPSGDVVVVGKTNSGDFPLVSPLWGGLNAGTGGGGVWDAFVTELEGATGRILASTFLGGHAYDEANAVAVGPDGGIVVGGTTNSSDFPVTAGAYDSEPSPSLNASSRAFVAVLGERLEALKAATYWGVQDEWSSGYTWVSALAVAPDGTVWAAGTTDSALFPRFLAFQPFVAGWHEGTLGAFSPSLDELRFSSYLGGLEDRFDPHMEEFHGIAVLASGDVVFGGGGDTMSMLRTAVLGIPDDPYSRWEHGILGVIDPGGGATDLRVEIDGPDSLLYMQDAVYTIRVINNGPQAALDPEMFFQQDNVRLGVTTDDPGVECGQLRYFQRCHRAVLNPGETMTASMHSISTGVLVTVRSRTSESRPEDNSYVKFMEIEPAPDLEVALGTPATRRLPPRPGEAVTYSFGILNRGKSAAEDVTVRQPVPAGATVRGWWSDTAACAVDGGVLECRFGRQEVMEGGDVTVLLELPSAGPVTLAAEVSTTTPEGDRLNNRATLDVEMAEGGGAAFHAALAGVAHNPGATGTTWRTDLVVLNPYATSTDVEMTFVGEPENRVRSVTIAPGEARRWTDVLVALFGFDPDATAAGAVHVRAARRVEAGARTYNLGPSGTFGQFMPAVEEPAEPWLLSGRVPWLRRGGGFRTNLGYLNLADAPCATTARVFDDKGATVLEKEISVPAGGWLQTFDVLGAAEGAPALGMAWVWAPECSLWTYASMVDGRTGDPTTVAALSSLDQTSVAYLPAAAHRPGREGTVWRTDLLVSPAPGTEQHTLPLSLLQQDSGLRRSAAVPKGVAWEIPDVVSSLFGQGAGDGAGGTLLAISAPDALVARTYNVGAGGTYGQSFSADEIRRNVIYPNEVGLVAFVEQDGRMRTNVGLVNLESGPDEGTAEIRLTLFDAGGRRVGEPKVVEVGSWGEGLGFQGVQPTDGGPWLQIDQIAKDFGAEELQQGYLTVELLHGDRIWAYASVIDQQTGDPMTVPLWRLLPLEQPW